MRRFFLATRLLSLAWLKLRGSKSVARIASLCPTPASETQPSSWSSCEAVQISGTASLNGRLTETGRASGRSALSGGPRAIGSRYR